MTSELPKYPWQVVGTDLFKLKANYLLVVDYFSRYPEVLQLTSTTSASVISALKSCSRDMGFPRLSRVITDHNTLQQNSWVLQAHMGFSTWRVARNSHRVMGRLSDQFRQSRICWRSQTTCIHLYWATERLHCLGVILVQWNWAWEVGFEPQSLRQIRCSYHMVLSENLQRGGQESESETERETRRFETLCKRSASYTGQHRGLHYHRQWAGVRKSDLTHRSATVVCCRNSVWSNWTQLTVASRENCQPPQFSELKVN